MNLANPMIRLNLDSGDSCESGDSGKIGDYGETGNFGSADDFGESSGSGKPREKDFDCCSCNTAHRMTRLLERCLSGNN